MEEEGGAYLGYKFGISRVGKVGAFKTLVPHIRLGEREETTRKVVSVKDKGRNFQVVSC
jgi:hypothetical protein